MGFPLKDVRLTTRRAEGGERLLYPRLIRDRSVLPKVDIATQYFESMLGSERRELDPEALVHFFGDHKLARCMVASLARSYRYRPRRFDEVVRPSALRRLQRAGIQAPKALRLRLFDHVNDWGHGFLPPANRQATLGQLEGQLGLRAGELDRLLFLDAEEHAVLIRVGDEPRKEDVVAQYNFAVLESLLRHAESVELSIAASAESRAALVRLGRANDVDVTTSGGGAATRVVLHGRQDAMGVWSRHGRRVARTVVQVLERGRDWTSDGTAQVVWRGRRARLRLTAELLDVLGGSPAPSMGWQELDGWGQTDLDAATRPRVGWSVRRLPEPRAWASGVIVPDLLLRGNGLGPSGAALVCAVRSPGQAERLAQVARVARDGEPLLFVGDEAVLDPLREVGAWTVAAPRFDLAGLLRTIDGGDRSAALVA